MFVVVAVISTLFFRLPLTQHNIVIRLVPTTGSCMLSFLHVNAERAFLCVNQQQQQSIRLSELHRKSQLWRGIVSIALIEGRSLIPMDPNGLSDPYVKFRLGPQKYKSKVCFLRCGGGRSWRGFL